MEMKLPVDFERLPEMRQLGAALRAAGCEMRDALACHLVMRLWVELAYQAQTSNEPGLLTEQGANLWVSGIEWTSETNWTDATDILQLMVAAGWLKGRGGLGDAPKEYFCERFARLNGHLAGDFKSRELRGAAASALERNRKLIATEAVQQAMLLSPEIFRDREGRPIAASEVQRLMVVIKTVDNALKLPGRATGAYSEGLIADAAAAVAAHSPEELREFYVWLSLNREHPVVPKTTEQVLAGLEGLIRRFARSK
jgi:hypothetical protein